MAVYFMLQPKLEKTEVEKWTEYFCKLSFTVQLLEPIQGKEGAKGDEPTHRYVMAMNFDQHRLADVSGLSEQDSDGLSILPTRPDRAVKTDNGDFLYLAHVDFGLHFRISTSSQKYISSQRFLRI